MDMIKELKNENEAELVATLACAYTVLALAPYDNWGHEGTPAQMAAFVVKTAKDKGNLGFLIRIFNINKRLMSDGTYR